MAHETLFIFSAYDFILNNTGSPALDIIQNRPFLAFDADAVETAETIQIVMPGQYSNSTLMASVYYMMASAVTGNVVLGVYVEAVSDGDSTDLDAGSSYDLINSATEAVPATTAGKLGVADITLTNKDSVVALDLLRFKLERTATSGSDDAVGDIKVLALEIWEQT